MSAHDESATASAKSKSAKTSDGSIWRTLGAGAVTLITAGILIWWLWEVATRIGTEPQTDANGAVTLDEWSRAKDILLVILPLYSAALAFWVGSQAGSQATTQAKQEAEGAQQQLKAVIDSAPEGTLAKAKQMHQDAFSG